MNEIKHANQPGAVSEIEALGVQLGTAYRQMRDFYRREYQLDPVAADHHARGLDDDEFALERDRIASEPADQVSWCSLTRLTERDPALAIAQWQRVKLAAANELASGHRTAAALEWEGTPWERARFLALRESFAESWRPRGRIETALIDMLATEFSTYLSWTEQATILAAVEAQTEKNQATKDRCWTPPRVSMAQAIASSTSQAEKAHRRFLLTVKALQELRRLPAVYVTAAERVTVGGQHVHVSDPPAERQPIEG